MLAHSAGAGAGCRLKQNCGYVKMHIMWVTCRCIVIMPGEDCCLFFFKSSSKDWPLCCSECVQCVNNEILSKILFFWLYEKVTWSKIRTVSWIFQNVLFVKIIQAKILSHEADCPFAKFIFLARWLVLINVPEPEDLTEYSEEEIQLS